MIVHGLHFRHLILIFLVLLINGCMSAEQTREKQPRKQVYIDANLLFEISYPEEWTRMQRPVKPTPLAEQTTTWQIDQQQGKEHLLELSILSLPAERNPYGYTGLETIINEQNNKLIITISEETAFPAGPTKKLGGQTPYATFEFWLYLGKQRHYIITCSAATAVFEQHQKQFMQIVNSFKTL